MADTLVALDHPRSPVVVTRPGWTFRIDLGMPRPAAPGSSEAVPTRLGSASVGAGSGLTLRHGLSLSHAAHRWVTASVAGDRDEPHVVPHDVHLTMHDDRGARVARWCLRRAEVAAVVAGRRDAVHELVLVCERIDLEPDTAAWSGALPTGSERRRSPRDGARYGGRTGHPTQPVGAEVGQLCGVSSAP